MGSRSLRRELGESFLHRARPDDVDRQKKLLVSEFDSGRLSRMRPTKPTSDAPGAATKILQCIISFARGLPTVGAANGNVALDSTP